MKKQNLREQRAVRSDYHEDRRYLRAASAYRRRNPLPKPQTRATYITAGYGFRKPKKTEHPVLFALSVLIVASAILLWVANTPFAFRFSWWLNDFILGVR